MSTSALLSRNAMNGVSGHMIEDQRQYHPLVSRDISNNLSFINFEGNNHFINLQNHNESSVNDAEDRLNFLPDNLYDFNSKHHLIEHSPLEEDEECYGNNMNLSVGQRKTLNMTETVPVPSSEHVAEIVGRQGCKIKSLRTQTNTYIKTPVRGAEPVFVVTGRRQDVSKAKEQILSAAEHFSSIRARRNGSAGAQPVPNTPVNNGSISPTSVPGQITMQVQVPYKVVGLVVGPKGATIKRIQQATNTYIVTPGRDKEPVFEVTGLPDQVDKAKEEIERHIASRTASDNNSDLQIDDFQVNGVDSGYLDQSADTNANNGNNNAKYNFNASKSAHGHDNLPPMSSVSAPSIYQHSTAPSHHIQHQKSHMNGGHSSTGANPSTVSAPNTLPISEFNVLHNYTPFQHSGFKQSSSEYDPDEGIGGSGSAVSIYDPAAFWNDAAVYGVQRSNSISVTGPRILPAGEDGPHLRTRRTNSDPLAAAFQRIDIAFSSASNSSSRGSTSPDTGRRQRSPARPCLLCAGKANSALVPCGHNSFCLSCAEEICQREPERRLCPVCHQVPEQVLMLR